MRSLVHSTIMALSICLAITGSCTDIPLDAGDSPDSDPHRAVNPLYRELRDKGVPIGVKVHQRLPAPTMADGLTAAQQQAVLTKLGGDDYPVEELLRVSVVAPHIYKFSDLPTQDPANLGRGTHLWFVAHGPFDRLTHSNLATLFQNARKDSKLKALTDAELEARSLKPLKDAAAEEAYFHTIYPMLERVQIQTTYRTVTSRAKDSVLLATRLEPAFAKDPAYPNQWRPLDPDESGVLKAGAPHPYDGAAMYLKITRLHNPPGAVFIELQQVFTEPRQWFPNPNILRSKLPLVVQSEVRAFRRELAKLK